MTYHPKQTVAHQASHSGRVHAGTSRSDKRAKSAKRLKKKVRALEVELDKANDAYSRLVEQRDTLRAANTRLGQFTAKLEKGLALLLDAITDDDRTTIAEAAEATCKDLNITWPRTDDQTYSDPIETVERAPSTEEE